MLDLIQILDVTALTIFINVIATVICVAFVVSVKGGKTFVF
jgi:hypothetical protein